MANKVLPQVADTSSAKLESLSPELQSRIDALGQRVDQLLSIDSSQPQRVQSADAQTAAVTPSKPMSGDDVIVTACIIPGSEPEKSIEARSFSLAIEPLFPVVA